MTSTPASVMRAHPVSHVTDQPVAVHSLHSRGPASTLPLRGHLCAPKSSRCSRPMSSSNLAQHVGRRIRDARSALAGRWLERLATRVTVGPRQIFPTDDLLDHMPLLIDGIGSFVEDSTQAIPADSAVVHHARELGALRHVQGFSEYEILKEFEILGGILFTVVKEEVARVGPMGDGTDIIACSHRLFQALALIQQSTTARFLELARDRTTERENRLRAFNRALTHEMRNRI